MTKIIGKVEFAHPLVPTAYLSVAGRTSLELDDNAKRVGTALRRLLPPEVEILAHRDKCFDPEAHAWRCTIPILMHDQEAKIRPILAQAVLRGSV